MRISLIRARINYTMIPPLGILYIGTLLEQKGHQVQVVDPLPEDNKDFIKQIQDFKPDIVGLSITTTQYVRGKKMLELLRPALPKVFYIAGGVHPTALPERTLKELDLDAVAVGEGEETMVELTERLAHGKGLDGVRGIVYRQNDTIIANEPRPPVADLNMLPIAKREFIDFRDYLVPPGNIRGFYLERATTMIASRGCPYNCIFCGSHLIFGRKVRRRTVANVMQEIRYLKDTYDIDGLWFLDDTFTVDPRWVLEFCQAFKASGIKLTWGCQVRVNTVSEEVLKTMKEVGCVQVDIGVESGSDKILKVMRKSTNRKMIIEAFEVIRKSGMRTLATFMLGNPEETQEDIDQTYDLIKKIKPNYVAFSFTTPFPGTDLNTMAIENGWIEKEIDFTEQWAPREAEVPVMEINFTKKELQKVRSRLQNAFFIQNFTAYLKNPGFLFKVFFTMLVQPKALAKAIGQFLRTGRVEHMLEEILSTYRKSMIKEK